MRDGSLTSRTDGDCLGGPGPSGGRGWASMGTTSRQEGQRHQQHRRSAGGAWRPAKTTRCCSSGHPDRLHIRPGLLHHLVCRDNSFV